MNCLWDYSLLRILPLDVKVVIASNDIESWFRLYLIDYEFHNYSRTLRARLYFERKFAELITIPDLDGEGEFVSQYLLGKIHNSIMPAVSYRTGKVIYYRNGLIHRDDDEPAIIYADGSQKWWIDGFRHRDFNMPAIVRENGEIEYWINGLRHRNGDLPAYIKPNVVEVYYKNGKIHRDRGLPAVVRDNGDNEYYVFGERRIEYEFLDGFFRCLGVFCH